jgi:hypothetical protein
MRRLTALFLAMLLLQGLVYHCFTIPLLEKHARHGITSLVGFHTTHASTGESSGD